ncbi:hypothetical protein ACFL4E_03490, partial [Candidatus Omnitrophota bacterium]
MLKSPVTRTSIEDGLLVGLLVFAPLALGSVHVWVYCVIAIISLILFNLHFLNNLSESHCVDG